MLRTISSSAAAQSGRADRRDGGVSEGRESAKLAAHAPVAQLDRAPGFEPGGRRFESVRARLALSPEARSALRQPFPAFDVPVKLDHRYATSYGLSRRRFV